MGSGEQRGGGAGGQRGRGAEGQEKNNNARRRITMPNSQFPMPHAQFPMPNAPQLCAKIKINKISDYQETLIQEKLIGATKYK